MWHNANSGMTMGVNFSATGVQKTLTGSTSGHSLNTVYYDLADINGNVVGKVFNNLKLFVIEDQELLFAMSYKSNRSWTLPAPVVGFNISVSSCPQCVVSATITKTDVNSLGGFGSITISNLINGDPMVAVFIQVNIIGNPTPVYFNRYSGNTTVISNLTAGNYAVTLYDTSSSNCFITYSVPIINNFASGWNLLNSSITNNLASIWFSDNNNGWAVGDGGTIIKSLDGGTTWAAQNSTVLSSIRSIQFIDANNGWACTNANSGNIIHTSNGGTTWAVQNSTIPVGLNSIHFVDVNNGWACGFGGNITHTSNGGTTWGIQSSITPIALTSIFFTDVNNGWAGGFNGVIVHTTNGGTSWTSQNSTSVTTINSIFFADVNNGWACDTNGAILHTSNGGATWALQYTATSGLLSIYFVDTNNGWACGYNGVIVYTINGGTSWTVQTSNTSVNLLSIKLNSSTLGWACGNTGTIIKYS